MASLNMDSCLWNAYSWSKAGPGKTRNTLGQSHPFCGKSSLCNSCWITCAISNWNKGTSENQLLSENSKLISVVASDFFLRLSIMKDNICSISVHLSCVSSSPMKSQEDSPLATEVDSLWHLPICFFSIDSLDRHLFNIYMSQPTTAPVLIGF